MNLKINPITAAIQVALLAMPAYVCAQNSATAPAGASSAPAPIAQIERIVVTAQKRLQDGQEVPVSMSVVPATMLESRGIADQSALAQVAPSLQVSDGNNFSIRGIGTPTSSGNQLLEGAVSTSIDGVNLSRPQMGNLQFADTERVEVLNGPQGMLFGKNATAGLISITTNRPKIGVTEGRLRVDLQHRTDGAEGNGIVTQAMVNVPISADSALRVNVFGTHQQPLVSEWRHVDGTDLGEKQTGAKLKYLWNPTEDLSVYLIGEYTERNGAGGTFLSRTRRSFGPGSFVSALVPSDVTVTPDNTTIAADGPSDYRVRSKGLQAEVNYELGGGYSLVDIVSHRSFTEFSVQDGDGVPVNFLDNIKTNFKFSQSSNELRLLTPAGKDFEAQVGLYLFRSKTDGDSFVEGLLGMPGPAVPGTSYNIGGFNNNKLTATNSAVFGQGTYKLTKDWRALLGLRYTRETQSMDLTQDDSQYGIIKLYPTLQSSQKARDTNFTYKAGTQYDLARDVMVYATYAHGAKGSGFNNQAGSPALVSALLVRPEKVNATELGLKSSFLDRRMLLNVTLFNQDYTDLQVQAYDDDLQAIVTRNAGKSRTRGAEVQMIAKPTANWQLSASGTWLDAKFTSFPGAPCALGRVCDATGERLPNAPRFTYTAQAEYKHELTESIRASYEMNAYHRTAVTYSIADPGTSVPAVTLLGASASLSNAAGDWRISLYCRNCTGKRFAAGVGADALDLNVPNPPVASFLQFFGYQSFRTIGVTGEYRF